MEEAIIALERRGISLRIHSERQDPVSGKLPTVHIFLGFEEHWFLDMAQTHEFIAVKEKELGHELRVDSGPPVTAKLSELEAEDAASTTEASRGVHTPGHPPSPNGELEEQGPRLRIVELHEVRTINNMLSDLKELGFTIEALIPQERTGEEGSRYHVRRGENETGLEDLRGLPAAIREAGQKGLTVTRFKGLGEMNAEELRETTLDPANRTLLKVSMEDAGAADELFRVLMGDNVEPRREFIQKHALDVRNLDV
jgi:DNA gyrase subunit B